MELQLAKGVRDNAPKEQIVRQRIQETIKKVFDSYGFLPLDTPVLERYDVLASKYAGGAEIMKEVFKLVDQGNRELCLRYDLTVPMCRFVGMNTNLKLPFKRYQMGPVFRDGPIKLGRYREFWQVDADIVGSKSMMVETELINLTFDAFEKLGLDIVIEFNSRKLMDGLLMDAGVQAKQLEEFILSVDKLKKFGVDAVARELLEKGFSQDTIEKALNALNGTLDEIKSGNTLAIEGMNELKELVTLVNNKKLVFNPALARGLSYYTGTVYEAYLVKSNIKSSLAAGGRYDNMIGNFLGGKQEYPAAGISFGVDVIKDALISEDEPSIAKVFVIPIKTEKQCVAIASTLRKAGINTDLDVTGRGISKNLNYANSLKIPFVIIVGEDETAKDKVTLRDMDSGKQELLSIAEVLKRLKA